jgi:hypothetical protein
MEREIPRQPCEGGRNGMNEKEVSVPCSWIT